MKHTTKKNLFLEACVIFVILILSFLLFKRFDALEKIVEWSRAYENYEIDEIFATAVVFAVLMMVFAYRRMVEMRQQVIKIQEKNEQLKRTQDENKQLKGILPICSCCKKIRDDQGYWNQLENYMAKHSEIDFSHSICPECAKNYYPDFDI